MNKYMKSEKGFVSIDAIISMTAILFTILVGIGIYGYLHPKIMLEKEVQTLAQKAKIQGGLTDKNSQPINSDIEVFKKRLSEKGYDISGISVEVVTDQTKRNCVGVTPIGETGNTYLRRDSKEMMIITAIIPAHTQGLMSPLRYFGINGGVSSNYYIRETVMSERW